MQAGGGLERTGVEFEGTDWGLYALVEFEAVVGWLWQGSKGLLLEMPYCAGQQQEKKTAKDGGSARLGGQVR